jgi:hypothetical protein
MLSEQLIRGVCMTPRQGKHGAAGRAQPVVRYAYRIVGITYSAPARMPVGHRDVIVLILV